MTTTWTSCATPPERDGMFLVRRCYSTGEQMEDPEPMRFDGEWLHRDGLCVMPYDMWVEMGDTQ
jgi:hypothetical protein